MQTYKGPVKTQKTHMKTGLVGQPYKEHSIKRHFSSCHYYSHMITAVNQDTPQISRSGSTSRSQKGSAGRSRAIKIELKK